LNNQINFAWFMDCTDINKVLSMPGARCGGRKPSGALP
jgi:hypothetical protein